MKRLGLFALCVISLAMVAGCSKSPVISIPPPPPPRFFVADIVNGLVVYTQPLSATSTASFTIPGASTIGVKFDTAGNLYVSNSATNTIAVYTPPVSVTSTPSFTIGPIAGAVGLRGLNFDSAGNLFAADNPGSQVFVFTPPFSAASVPSKTITGMLNPENAVFDSAGNMINVGFNTSTVYVFRPPFANGANVPVATLALPGNGGGIAIDLKDDLVVGLNTGGLAIFRPPFATGNVPAAIIAPPIISGFTATEALNMTFDASGNLWVPYAGFNLPGQPGVAVFSPPFGGTSAPIFGFSAGLAGPFGVAFGP